MFEQDDSFPWPDYVLFVWSLVTNIFLRVFSRKMVILTPLILAEYDMVDPHSETIRCTLLQSNSCKIQVIGLMVNYTSLSNFWQQITGPEICSDISSRSKFQIWQRCKVQTIPWYCPMTSRFEVTWYGELSRQLKLFSIVSRSDMVLQSIKDVQQYDIMTLRFHLK